MYLTISRPDIAFVVNKLSQFMTAPQFTLGQGILFSSKSSLALLAYANVDWGSCITTGKSTTSFCIFIGDSLVTWKSKKQITVSRSFAKAEYIVLALLSSHH